MASGRYSSRHDGGGSLRTIRRPSPSSSPSTNRCSSRRNNPRNSRRNSHSYMARTNLRSKLPGIRSTGMVRNSSPTTSGLYRWGRRRRNNRLHTRSSSNCQVRTLYPSIAGC